jgi:hypothetical protein
MRGACDYQTEERENGPHDIGPTRMELGNVSLWLTIIILFLIEIVGRQETSCKEYEPCDPSK